MRSRATCAVVTIWPEIPPNGARLSCCLSAGHDGEHACAEVEYIEVESP
jgi:hypothetical protein